jgi:D-alanyl-D-alanine carboxypeptidase
MDFDRQKLVARIESCLNSLGIPYALVAERNLPLFHDAGELVVIGNSSSGSPYYLTPEAGNAWFGMRDAAESDGVILTVVSAFRSFQRQYEIVKSKIEKGIRPEIVFSVSAPPGYSEHHTGRALDINTLDCIPLDLSFEKTPAFSWLRKNAEKFGFELSYPASNPFGFEYEPWHWCYQT